MNISHLKPSGQIVPGTRMGDALTELARSCKTIVETGTWNGLGSTLCLLSGMGPESHLYSVEASLNMYRMAKRNLACIRKSSLTLIHGSVVEYHEMPLRNTHSDSLEVYYFQEMVLAKVAPHALYDIPRDIDLLLLDGAQFGGDAEFSKLWPRAGTIVLDDTHPTRGMKHTLSRQILLRLGWNVLYDEPNDRNGWFIAKR